jgi:L-threonylcarbamoyladenylate synthase
LRKLDEKGVDLILAETFPKKGIGLAIMDRLQKAASKYEKFNGRNNQKSY